MTTHRFKQFRVGDLFDIHPTKTYKGNNSDLFDDNGKNPVLGNTSMNNGIGGYSSKPCTENGGIITFSDTTTADAIFYQPNPFIGYSHVQGMYPYSTKWSEKSLLYFLTVFKKIAIESGFDYANKFNRKIAAEFIVSLPVKCSYVIDISSALSTGGTMMYKTYRLDEVFEKIKTNTLPYKAKELPTKPDDKYNLPALTAGVENQGLSCFVPRNNATILKNCISVSANGANTGVMFYQPKEFTVLQDSYALKYKGSENIGEKEYLYLISVMQKIIKGNFDWSNKAGWERIRSLEISLPVTEVEEIDFEYMAARIKELEAARIKELEAALRVMGLHDTKLTDVEIETLKNNPEFKKFKMGALFEAQTGDIDLQQKDVNGKGVFFVNSGLNNCGIKGKTDRPAKTFSPNTITVDFWGNAFYRDFEYKMATHNHVFSLSGDVIKNERVGLYLVVQMSYFKNCFSYTNMGTWNKIKELEIELPVTDSGELDFDYMENYILAIEKQTIQKLYDDKGILINATKKII